MVIITRSNLSAGQQSVQSLHALAEFAEKHPATFFRWQIEQKNIVLLSVKDEQSLTSLYDKIEGEKSTFQEPDINNQTTAICFYPTESDCKAISSIPLALKNYKEPDSVLNVV